MSTKSVPRPSHDIAGHAGERRRRGIEDTVSALVATIVRDRCGAPDVVPPHGLAAATRFLLDQQRRMPDYLRLPLYCLVIVFDAWALPFTGHTFQKSTAAEQSRQVSAWRSSRLGFRRDLIKFYETLAVFAVYTDRYADNN